MQNFASDKISSFYLRGRTWLYFLFFELPNLVFLFFFFNNGEWFFFFFFFNAYYSGTLSGNYGFQFDNNQGYLISRFFFGC